MSVKELSRVGVLARVKAGTLSVRSAAVLLHVGYRQAKRLVGRYRRTARRACDTRAWAGRRITPGPVRSARKC